MSGDSWRWRPEMHWPPVSTRSIAVIERTKADEAEAAKRTGRRVPFGFARELTPEPEPLRWEGDDS